MGVLGCSDVARRRTLPAMAGHPLISLTAVASRSPAKAAAFAAEFGCDAVDGYRRLLERPDVDAVYVPLPTGLHAAWVHDALSSGRHVLAEKPLSTDFAQAAQLVALARSRGLLLRENFTFLHHSQHTAVRRLLEERAIGELRSLEAVFGIPPLPRDDIRYRPDLGGGALLDVGVYPIRAATLFLGAGLKAVGAVCGYDPQSGVDTSGSALLHAPDGVSAHLTFGFTHSYRSAYALWGSRGRLVLERAFTPPADHRPVVRVECEGRVTEHRLPADHQFARTVGDFARAALAGETDDGAEILRQAALVDAVRDAGARTSAVPLGAAAASGEGWS
jgi:NDP-hexose-3-ketoreductase